MHFFRFLDISFGIFKPRFISLKKDLLLASLFSVRCEHFRYLYPRHSIDYVIDTRKPLVRRIDVKYRLDLCVGSTVKNCSYVVLCHMTPFRFAFQFGIAVLSARLDSFSSFRTNFAYKKRAYFKSKLLIY